MGQAKYDSKIREVSSPMDAHIDRVDEGDKELHFEVDGENMDSS